MSEERLQKILARAGVASRRKVEELIREARVTINGRVAEIGDKADLERDAVKLDGKRILPKAGAHHYLLLNKPRGVMSTIKDPEGRPTVLDLVPPGLRKALVPVGRLDFQTEGLLLLTDDGDFAQHVAHPRYGCVKTYEAKVKGHPEPEDIARLEAGIVLDGKRTSPCRITARPVPRRAAEGANSWWSVELSEGRTRQIRDMFERIGHPVQKLRRVAIGPVRDPRLPVGSLRDLTEREVEQLRRATRERPARVSPARPKKRLTPATPAPSRRAAKPSRSAR
jgi:23S rRNA pseudouridine2605 synthase